MSHSCCIRVGSCDFLSLLQKHYSCPRHVLAVHDSPLVERGHLSLSRIGSRSSCKSPPTMLHRHCQPFLGNHSTFLSKQRKNQTYYHGAGPTLIGLNPGLLGGYTGKLASNVQGWPHTGSHHPPFSICIRLIVLALQFIETLPNLISTSFSTHSTTT